MRALRNAVKRLRIKKGDIVIAHPALQDQFRNLTVPEIDWKVPILWTVNVRSLRTIDMDKLRELLRKEDKSS